VNGMISDGNLADDEGRGLSRLVRRRLEY